MARSCVVLYLYMVLFLPSRSACHFPLLNFMALLSAYCFSLSKLLHSWHHRAELYALHSKVNKTETTPSSTQSTWYIGAGHNKARTGYMFVGFHWTETFGFAVLCIMPFIFNSRNSVDPLITMKQYFIAFPIAIIFSTFLLKISTTLRGKKRQSFLL